MQIARMSLQLALNIVRSPWAVHPSFVLRASEIIPQLLTKSETFNSTGTSQALEEITPDGIAVISIIGATTKYDEDCGAIGTQSIAQSIQEADDNQKVKAIILRFDTPGGQVSGTQELEQTVQNTTKPIVAYVSGMMCSAGMWVGSATDRIIASEETAEIGSIGVMTTLSDARQLWENEGVKVHHIFADQSTHKNKNFIDALDGDYKGIKEESLNPIGEIFINTIKANRPNVAEDALSGRTFFAKDAINKGLIDAIGNFEYTKSVALELANQNQNNNMVLTNKTPQINAQLGVEPGATLTESQLEAIETSIATGAADKENVTAAQTSITALEAEVISLKAEKEALEATNAKLGEKPAQGKTTPKKENEEAAAADNSQSVIDTLSHNEALANNPLFN